MKIYIAKNGQQLGPFDEEELTKQITEGTVSYDDLAWVEGMVTWQPLRTITSPPAGGPPSLPTRLPVMHPSTPTYGGFMRRLAACFVDVTVTFIPCLIVLSLLDVSSPAGHRQELSGYDFCISFMKGVLVGGCIRWIYYAMMESSSKQATLGKQLLGLRVTDLAGRRISFGRASGRYFGKYLLGIFGYIWMAFTDKKQALHDWIANTVVIRF